MAVNVTKIISAGADVMFYGVRDGAGYFNGPTATAVANGSGAGMALLEGVKNAPHSVAEPESVAVTGDNSVLGSFQFEPNELSSFILELATRDLTFEALAQSTLVATEGDISLSVIQPKAASYTNIIFLVTGEAQSRASGSIGTPQFETLLIPNATVVPLSRDGFAERAPATYRYRVTCNPVDKLPWGLALSDATNGTTESPAFTMNSENRLHVYRASGDGTTDDFVLTYSPAEASSDKVRVYVDGVLKTYTTDYTVTIATKTVTFAGGSIPTAGQKIVILYEYTQ